MYPGQHHCSYCNHITLPPTWSQKPDIVHPVRHTPNCVLVQGKSKSFVSVETFFYLTTMNTYHVPFIFIVPPGNQENIWDQRPQKFYKLQLEFCSIEIKVQYNLKQETAIRLCLNPLTSIEIGLIFLSWEYYRRNAQGGWQLRHFQAVKKNRFAFAECLRIVPQASGSTKRPEFDTLKF